MKKQILFLVAIVLIAITNAQAIGLTKGQVGGTQTSSFTIKAGPTVLSTDPLDKATGIALDKVITVTFSEPMDPMTISTSTFIVKQGDKDVAGKVEYAGSTVKFTPSSDLEAGAVYMVSITKALKSAKGMALSDNVNFSFTTVGAPAEQ